jgi:hypothetical protein
MTEPDEIAEVFGIFHDGCIAGGSQVDHTAELVVEIEYLAERIRPTDRKFTIRIDNLEQVRFTPWTDEGRPSIPDITSFAEIVLLGLEVLSAETEGPKVKIACSQGRPNQGYCGGVLEMAAEGCRVFDESGHEWNLGELSKLADNYWSDWANRNKNAQQGGAGQPATRSESE